MRSVPLAIAGFVLCALVIIATCVLLVSHVTPPAWFEALAIFSAGGATGAIIPTSTPTQPSSSSSGSVVGPPHA